MQLRSNYVAGVVLLLLAGLMRSTSAQVAPVTPTTPGATTEPGRPTGENTGTTSKPSTGPNGPLIAFTPITIPIEIPALSGTLVDQFAYSFHGQATIIPQFHGSFNAPYSGRNSFSPSSENQSSYSGTLFMGIRVLPGTEIYFDPEVTTGAGLSNVFGLGDAPNGDTPRTMSDSPAPVVARLFVRQTFGFGGEQESTADAANFVQGKQDIDRLTVTVGKFAVNDVFDNNSYAHDPRSQFLNWGLFDDDAWDYSGDTKGYTQGLTLELNQKNDTLRYGIFRVPANANGGLLDTHFDRAFDQVVEYEQRYSLFGKAGAIRPMGYFNEAHMGDYRNAILQSTGVPNVTATRSYSHPKYGVGASWEQSLTSDLAVFGRAGWNNGQSETWSFTEVDRAVSLGLSLKGTAWHRPQDVIGLAGVMSGLSKDHRDYLAEGGVGFALGDGRLHYAPEEVIETYYSMVLTKNIFLSADYQFIDHPGFNSDRGPVSIGGFRVHVEF